MPGVSGRTGTLGMNSTLGSVSASSSRPAPRSPSAAANAPRLTWLPRVVASQDLATSAVLGGKPMVFARQVPRGAAGGAAARSGFILGSQYRTDRTAQFAGEPGHRHSIGCPN